MRKRRYTNMVAMLPVIEAMLAAGMSHREIENELGLEGDRPIHNLLKRQRRKECQNFVEGNQQRHCRNTRMKTSGSGWK